MTPLQAADLAAESKITVYTIAVGGDEQAKIPVGKDFFGRTRYQYIPGGSVDFEVMEKIAGQTNGKSFLAKDPESLKNVFDEIQKLEKTEIKSQGHVIYEEFDKYFILFGSLCWIFGHIGHFFIRREMV